MAIDLSYVFLNNTIYQYAVFFGVIAWALLIGKLVTWVSRNILKKIAAKTDTKVDDIIVGLFDGPILFTVFIIALYFAHDSLTLSDPVQNVINKILLILLIINAAWYLIRFLASVLTHYIEPLTAHTETDLDDHLLPILRRLVTIVIVVIAVILIMDKLGFNVSTLVAGLGIGGLAFALAAQDMLGNFFGGVAIMTDRPFKVGDRVKIGTDVDGNVREIGLRTTRVETLGGTMVVVPNRKVVDSILENITNEKERRVVMVLDLEYDTPVKKLDEAKKLLIANIKKTKDLDHQQYNVAFSEFGQFSLKMTVIYWITKKGLDRYWDVQDELHTAIKRDFEKAKIEFAYPTQTVKLKK